MPSHPTKGPKWDAATGIPDLAGKVAIITGANSSKGIGFNVAHSLALHGARVYVGARSASKSNDAIAEMRKKSGAKTLDLKPLIMDLSGLKKVKACASAFVEEESRLDILVNNAAITPRPFEKDANGISLLFTTNHLGPFLFTVELLPLLKRTAAIHPGVRVVTLSSQAHAMLKPGVKFSCLEDLNAQFGGTSDFNINLQHYGATGLSKLANVLFTKELQRHFERENVDAIAISVHPGAVRTNGAARSVGDDSPLLDGALTPSEGAITPLFAATNPAVWVEKDKYKGAYLIPFDVLEEASADAKNEELARQLWETSEKVVQSVLAK